MTPSRLHSEGCLMRSSVSETSLLSWFGRKVGRTMQNSSRLAMNMCSSMRDRRRSYANVEQVGERKSLGHARSGMNTSGCALFTEAMTNLLNRTFHDGFRNSQSQTLQRGGLDTSE